MSKSTFTNPLCDRTIANTLVSLATDPDPTALQEFLDSKSDDISYHDVRLALLTLATQDHSQNMQRFLEHYNKPGRLAEKNMLDLALVVACQHNNVDVVKCILQSKKTAAFPYTTDNVLCALGYAVCNHNMELLQLLIENNVFPRHLHQTQNSKYPPLTLAAHMGYLDMVQYLVENGVLSVPCTKLPILNAMEAAAESNHVEIVRYLHENFPTHFEMRDVLLRACNCGSWDVISYIHDLNNTYIHEPGYMYEETPIVVATKANQLRIVKWLVEQKVCVNTRVNSKTVTDLAVMYHYWDMVEFLMKNGGICQYQIHNPNDLDLLAKNVPGVDCDASWSKNNMYFMLDEFYHQLKNSPSNTLLFKHIQTRDPIFQATLLRHVCSQGDYSNTICLIEKSKIDIYFKVNNMDFVDFAIYNIHEPIVRYLHNQQNPSVRFPKKHSIHQPMVFRKDVRLTHWIRIDQILHEQWYPWLKM